MTEFHIIIPARYQSSRLPGKPLMRIGHKTMIQHVVERARESSALTITVATDDRRIESAVTAFGGQAVMTSLDHQSGSDRIAQAVEILGLDDDAIVVNVQGDEPAMPPALIDQVAALLVARSEAVMATVSAPLENREQLLDPAIVKVVTDHEDYALYFSRATIPWARSRDSADLAENAVEKVRRHLGIYAYHSRYIRQFASRKPCYLESLEKLEQLRTLWHGERIACAHAVTIPCPGVDSEADLERMRRFMR